MSGHLIEDLPFADYLTHPALSASGMKRLLDVPARFKVEQADTAAMRHGRLIHALTFDQPHDLVVKDWDARTNPGKARRDEVLAAHGVESADDLDLVSADDWEAATAIAEALKANTRASEVLFPSGVRHEVSAVWTDPETGVELRCRFDALGAQAIGDLKSTTNAQPATVARDAAKYGYYLSAAHYLAAAKALDLPAREFLLIAVEKKAPHFISVVGINQYDLQLAELLRRKAIRIYAECMERDQWPDYTADVAYPDAPGWWRIAAEQETGLYEIEIPA